MSLLVNVACGLMLAFWVVMWWWALGGLLWPLKPEHRVSWGLALALASAFISAISSGYAGWTIRGWMS